MLLLELHIDDARSLKDRRRVVRALKDRLRRRYNVSVAETDSHNTLRRAEVAVAVAARRASDAESLLREIEQDAAALLGRRLEGASIEIL